VSRWHTLAIWLVVTLLAIYFIGDAPFLALGIVVGGGVAFGIASAAWTRRSRGEMKKK
jgi:hypothetical protein